MSTSAVSICDAAEDVLQDSRLTTAELFEFLKDGEIRAVNERPQVNPVSESVALVAGTVQTLPNDRLIAITHNMGVSPGDTEGAPITVIDRAVMDQFYSSWRTATASATVQHVMFNSDRPLEFECYPPQPASGFGYVKRIMGKVPDEIPSNSDGTGYTGSLGTEPANRTEMTDNDVTSGVVDTLIGSGVDDALINLDDMYKDALLYYVLHRAYLRNSDVEQDAGAIAASYLGEFLKALGVNRGGKAG